MNYKLPERFPPLPRTQALNSKTFRPPPLDGTLTIPEIFDWHLRNTPDHPLLEYVEDDGSIRSILWPEAVRAIHRTARLMRVLMGCDPEQCPDVSSGVPVIAILAGADSITYFTLQIAIQRACYAVFPISPRNSPEAVAHLLANARVAHILVGREQFYRDLVDRAIAIIPDKYPGSVPPVKSVVPIFEDLFTPQEGETDDLAFRVPPKDAPALITHSSGSTSYPKVIPWTADHLKQLCSTPYFGDIDLTGKRIACHSLPFFHAFGIMQPPTAAACGAIVTAFKPKSPATFPTPDLVIKGAFDNKCDVLCAVPSYIEAWSRNPAYIEGLCKLDAIVYAGGPLNTEIGDSLVAKGASIVCLYGISEAGILSPFISSRVTEDWEYFRITDNVKTHYIPDGSGRSELVVVCNEWVTPAVLNMAVDGVPAYNTSDLLVQHPTKPNLWKIYGRTDDQIMHNTGEKTNPGPLEIMLNQDPHVFSSVMFGRGRFQAGVLIEPKPEHKFDPKDTEKLTEFRNKIWPTVEQMNNFAPQHSRIFKEMILVTSPSKPFTYGGKNTPRRPAIVNDYEAEIAELYDEVSKTAQADIPPPEVWDNEETLRFIRTVVGSVLHQEVQDDTDLFQEGCDSLQAIWIRNSILHALRESAHLETRLIPHSIVYQYPSIKSLVSFVQSVLRGSAADRPVEIAVEEMNAMVETYSSHFDHHQGSSSSEVAEVASELDVVLLTGTTGALGANILAHLAGLPDVERVYAVNRPSKSDVSLKERHVTAFKDRGLDPAILDGGKVVLVEADLSDPDLGVHSDILEQMRTSVTHIIHNAWPVDFNLSLKSFEPSIKALRHLIDFALSSSRRSPPPLLFTSSIGVFRQPDLKPPYPEVYVHPEVAAGMGYSESKWVAEKILEIASRNTTLRPITVRVGQLSGGLNGAWNVKEWLPSMIRSSVSLGCLPDGNGVVSWIPVHTAAAALSDFRNADLGVLHLVHPKPATWSSLFKAFSQALNLPLIPYAAWLGKLEQSGANADVEDLEGVPAIRLLDFFRDLKTLDNSDADFEAFGFPTLSAEAALRSSQFLSDENLPSLGEADVQRWLGYWKNVGYL